MLMWLGGWLRRLVRSQAVQDQRPARQEPVAVEQRADGRQAIQIGRVESLTLVQGPAGQPAANDVAELQQLQVTVLRLVETSGDRRGAVEAFMVREFGTARITHLSRSQLRRVQRYCEAIESRLLGRRGGA